MPKRSLKPEKQELKTIKVGETVLRLYPRFEELFSGAWSFPPQKIPLVGKMFNRVERTIASGDKGRHIVFKSGTDWRVKREFENYVLFNSLKLTAIRTITPLGYQTEGRKGFLYTLLEQGVIPLRSIRFPELLPRERQRFIERCAKALGEMHSLGVTHNDFKVKNILYRPRSSDPLFVVDLAKMTYSQKGVSERMRCYDVLSFLGNAVHHELVTSMHDVERFAANYFKGFESKKPTYTAQERSAAIP